ncbi:competence protein ComK [Psychrobacillus soli]|nr:competence protein ComK [Psychrobacillus soli]
MFNKKDENSFLISFDTAVLQPVVINNKVFTKAISYSGESKVIGKRPYDIVRHSCSYYGSSFQQSTKLSKEAIGNYLKLPILIAHDFGSPCILIPILSPRSDLNIWFSLGAIESFYPSEDGCTIVLSNGQMIQVPSSPHTISRQLGFANLLNMHFLKRMSHLVNNGLITSQKPLFQKDLFG